MIAIRSVSRSLRSLFGIIGISECRPLFNGNAAGRGSIHRGEAADREICPALRVTASLWDACGSALAWATAKFAHQKGGDAMSVLWRGALGLALAGAVAGVGMAESATPVKLAVFTFELD